MGLFGRDIQPTRPGPVQAQGPSIPGPLLGTATRIAEGSKISGDAGGSSDLRIEGEFEGSVFISGIVFIAETGQVRASIRAARVTVAGRVDGDISSDQLIELQPTAVVNGNLLAPKILIQEGASLQGQVEMASPPQETAVGKSISGKKRDEKQRARKTHQAPATEESGKDDNGGQA